MDESAALEMLAKSPTKRIPHMRTVDNIVKELKKLDPGCDVSTYCIRQLVKRGALRALPSGAKLLINLWDVLDIMSIGVSQDVDVEDDVPPARGIRRIVV